MDYHLTENEYRQQNPEHESDSWLKCDICEVVTEEVYECTTRTYDALCEKCADSVGYFLCERCTCYSDEYGPNEECQSCYETSIDAAHDYLGGER